MSETKKLITSLDEKVELLLKHIKEQQANLESKKRECEELSKTVATKESKIKELEAENARLKSTPSESNQDSDDMKVRISELVQEIDKCISLLKV
ncbi:MAG: hypothetical protein HUJ25_13910 [Crocinitomicaceae bacterium]|nr:hypothetical protein [Crocinitomicaceae bacterium]